MVRYDGHWGQLYNLASAEHFRRYGGGRALVSPVVEWLHQRNLLKAQLLVQEADAGVVPFHESLGYEVALRVFMIEWLEHAT